MKADKQSFLGGSPDEKVAASGDLVLVEKRLEETRQTLSRLLDEHGGAWEDFTTELEPEVDLIKASCERWAEKLE